MQFIEKVKKHKYVSLITLAVLVLGTLYFWWVPLTLVVIAIILGIIFIIIPYLFGISVAVFKRAYHKFSSQELPLSEFKKMSKDRADRHAQAFVDGLNANVRSENQSQDEEKS